MKKFYLFTVLFLFAFFTNAQITVQGVPRNDLSGNTQLNTTNTTSTLSFSDIQYWVGTGSNQAAFVVQWNDSKIPDALVWGFRWDGNATGEDMLKAIAKADRRFFTLLYQGTQFGTAVGGLGFDLDGQNSNALIKSGNTTYPLYPLNGIVNTTAYDFDDYTAQDTNDHWGSGWYNGFWSYYVKNPADADFGFSGVGATSRILQNGSWDVWNYSPMSGSFPISSTLTPVSPYVTSTDFTNGFFMVNEEWYGHTNGSVNFISNNGPVNYRVYSEVNNNHAFGATTQYGTIYGDKFYFVSKQAADGGDSQYTPGGRLVVANAQTMQKIATFNTIGTGDGRSFLGVNQHKGYIGASNGIYLFDIDNMQVGNMIAGTGGGSQYAGQIGNMIRTSHYVFAVKQTAGILVIDPNTDTVVNTIAGAFSSIVQAKDGSIWAIQNQKLANINPATLIVQYYNIPTSKYSDSWGAWNAGSFTASNSENTLYWIKAGTGFNAGNQIVKFDVTTKAFNENFITLPGQSGNFKQIPYGAALRVNPATGNLILNTTESGYGAHFLKNWIHTFDASGNLINTKTLNDYYWFPSLAVFPDNSAPTVSNTFPAQVTAANVTSIDLKTMVSDEDSFGASIVKTVKSNNNSSVVSAEINADEELIITPLATGFAEVVISFNSNGKVVERTLAINSLGSTLATTEVKKLEFEIYPNPVTDVLYIKTQEKIGNVSVYDASGKLMNTQFSNGQVNVRMLPKGLYILKATTDKAIYQQKLMKK
ncbi:DUF5074 domain-containing protein [Chryseobacterium indologenes]|uniref:DUF5074 domain-containing protein n=1 Tax=Chryseobacterium indologenes TaxID=253 RepID=UPI000B51A71F|nr:DUF5074 domain-containing protein [Chryseobacterium indologenes]ASE63632.1 DUF5074 domain-containing protein [Chryseobacterium indologenes]